MITRLWRARAASTEAAEAYQRYFSGEAVLHLNRIPGFQGARLLARDSDGLIEILVMTLWDSMDAVRAFAGERADVAVVEPAVRAILSEFDDQVSHYNTMLAIS